MKPMIGLVPLVDQENHYLRMVPDYFEGILTAGGIPVMLPLLYEKEDLEQAARIYDGFLFTGGPDLDPAMFQEKSIGDLVQICEERDRMEPELLKMVMKYQKPVLGICRGIQTINVVLGGSLYQDIPTQYETKICHRQKEAHEIPTHELLLVEGTPLQLLTEKKILNVNSFHHQAVKQLAPGLKAMAYSRDGILEALYKPDYPFLWGVQWHPEYLFPQDPFHQIIFREFVKAAAL